MQKEEDYIMSQTPSIKKNVAFKLAYQVLAILVPLVTAPYVSRVLGADGIGIYSYTHSYMTYFTMFAALGTVSYGTRQIAQVRDDSQKLSKTFLLQIRSYAPRTPFKRLLRSRYLLYFSSFLKWTALN